MEIDVGVEEARERGSGATILLACSLGVPPFAGQAALWYLWAPATFSYGYGDDDGCCETEALQILMFLPQPT